MYIMILTNITPTPLTKIKKSLKKENTGSKGKREMGCFLVEVDYGVKGRFSPSDGCGGPWEDTTGEREA